MSLAGGYHGETVGALAVTDVAIFRDAYAPLLRQAATSPAPTRVSRRRASAVEVAVRAAASLEEWLDRHHRHTAALIVEPLVQAPRAWLCTTPSTCALHGAVHPLRGAPDRR